MFKKSINMTFILKRTIKKIVIERNIHQSRYDVVILGGGMVGSSLALSLGKLPSFANKNILLVESEDEIQFDKHSKYRSRVSALSPATHKLLTNIDCWKNIEDIRYRPIKHMQVWDAGGPSCISFGKNNNNPLAYVVENDIISASITKESKLLDNLQIYYKCRNVDLKLTDGKGNSFTQVKLNNGETIEASLLIGADGANSSVRKYSNISLLSCNYHQQAVVAVCTLDQLDNNNTAWQRFLPTGPIALLPLSSDKSCLIWSTTAEQANHLTKCDNKEFIMHVNNAFNTEDYRNDISSIFSHRISTLIDSLQLERTRHMLPPIVLDTCSESIAKFPLKIQHATHYVKSGLALIGDAAHRLHPLSGQGLNLGFGDVECLTNILNTAALNGADLGSLHHLIEYESSRQKHVVSMLLIVDFLNRLYSTSYTPSIIVRNFVCQIFDSIDPIKNLMMQMASSNRN